MVVGFISYYLCNQCLSPLTLWVRISLRRGVLDTALCDKVCQWLVAGRWFSPGTQVSSINKTDRHDITEILLNVALNTITTLIWNWYKLFYLTFCIFSFEFEESCLSDTRCLIQYKLFTFLSVDMEILTPWSSQVYPEAQPKGVQATEGC